MPFDYDDQIVTLVSRDAGSMDAVIQILQGIDKILDGSRDGLKWFNSLYLAVTLAVHERVAAAGFDDAEGAPFIARLDFVFANLYFAALRGWFKNGDSPRCWRLLFEQRANASLARIQFALAGVNAHINRDLAVAVAAMTTPVHGTPQYRAYTALNSTLNSLIEKDKRELMVTLPGDSLPGAACVEFAAAAWSIAVARESAWVHAEILSKISGEQILAGRFVDALDASAALAGKALLAPPL